MALLVYVDADIVCLQEAAGLATEAVAGLGYRVILGAARRGGGLATLLHARLLAGGRAVSINAPAHGAVPSVATEGTGGITVVNLHLVPSLATAERDSLCPEAVVASQGPGRLARFLCGDLNATLTRSWLSTALRPGRVWSGWRCPYRTGIPTNIVERVGGRRSTLEIDWILISPDTPCRAARRVCLPGISTHQAVQCDLDLVVDTLLPLDPTGRQFAFNRLLPC